MQSVICGEVCPLAGELMAEPLLLSNSQFVNTGSQFMQLTTALCCSQRKVWKWQSVKTASLSIICMPSNCVMLHLLNTHGPVASSKRIRPFTPELPEKANQ